MKKFPPIIRRLGAHSLVAALGFAGGLIVFYLIQLRQGPALEPWHTARLSSEFSAEKAAEIRTWEDYLALEDRLFSQLQEQVYARTGQGPDFLLARYSTGSAADPARRQPNWNRSFELPAETPAGGVLLLHGMTDSPYSLRALGEQINQHNYWVVGLRLPGHGTAPAGLRHIATADLTAAVKLGVDRLVARVGNGPIHIIGYSFGAALALDYVLKALADPDQTMPGSLVLISPAIAVSPAAALAKWLDRVAGIPGLGKLAWEEILPEFDPYKYNSFAFNAAYQVYSLTRSVATRLSDRAARGPIQEFPPTLAFLSTVDDTVSAAAVIDNLLIRLPPARSELVLFDINRHSAATSVLVADPGPLTARLMADAGLPFSLTLITNTNARTSRVISRRKPPFSSTYSTQSLGDLAWPDAVISLSHVALPFSPDDLLYGRERSGAHGVLHLGQIPVQGERGLLNFPADSLLRLRHNPFFDFLEERTVQWLTETD